jgi:hypothetical protein
MHTKQQNATVLRANRRFLNPHSPPMLGIRLTMSPARRHRHLGSLPKGHPSSHHRWTRRPVATLTVALCPPVRSRTLTRCPLTPPQGHSCRRHSRIRRLFDQLHRSLQPRRRAVLALPVRDHLSWTRSRASSVPSEGRCSPLPIRPKPPTVIRYQRAPRRQWTRRRSRRARRPSRGVLKGR